MMFGLSMPVLELLGVSLVAGILCFVLGTRRPAEKNEDKWRQVWAGADVAAVLLTAVGVVKLMNPLIAADQLQADLIQKKIASYKKENTLYAVNRAEDRFCPIGRVPGKDSILVCDAIRRMERLLVLADADAVTANVILDQILPAVCSQRSCDPVFEDIKRQTADFRVFYLAHRKQIEGKGGVALADVRDAMILTTIYLLITSFRLGRSGSEIARNRLARKRADAEKGKPGMEERLQALHARVACLETGCASIASGGAAVHAKRAADGAPDVDAGADADAARVAQAAS